MSQKRILYLMHVDWRWIKQRPHYLAEGLMSSYEVLVAYRAYLDRTKYPENKSAIARTPLIPWIDRGASFWRTSDAFLNRARISSIIKRFKPDLIWLCFPSLYAYLPASASHIPIVYDCMDLDHAFYENEVDKAYILNLGTRLISDARLVLCSSQFLLEDVITRRQDANVLLLRNGLQDDWVSRLSLEPQINPGSSGTFNLAFIGTIAAWFDWALMMSALERFPNLRLHMIGPSDGALKNHPQIIYHGIIAHEKLPALAREFDAFVMPFVRSSLIEGVDPVKLYEYLSFGQEVFALRYAEIERFDRFVHLYRDQHDFMTMIERHLLGRLPKKNNPELVRSFLLENTWNERALVVKTALQTLLNQ